MAGQINFLEGVVTSWQVTYWQAEQHLLKFTHVNSGFPFTRQIASSRSRYAQILVFKGHIYTNQEKRQNPL